MTLAFAIIGNLVLSLSAVAGLSFLTRRALAEARLQPAVVARPELPLPARERIAA